MRASAVRTAPAMRSAIIRVPPPVGGLNTRDALMAMKPSEGVALVNMFPESSYIRIRRGAADWSNGYAAPVESLMEYAGAARFLFAASGTSIYDASGVGPVGAAVVTGLTNARWSSVMLSNAGGTYLVAVNGADGVRTFNGSVWATQAITGVTASTLTSVTTYARRLWFTQANTSKVWYLGTDAISGAANSLDLGGVWRQGGSCQQILALQYSTQGSGLTQYIGFVSTNGEMAVYSGGDPTNAADWSLVGVYLVAPPVSNRSWQQSGGDAVMLTKVGVVSLLGMLGVDLSVSQQVSASAKITDTLRDAWENYGTNFGWQLITFPNRHMLIVNVPTGGGAAVQYVMNTLTGAWCQFTGWAARCFALFDGWLYYGTTDRVVKAYVNLSDLGAAIPWSLQTAFNSAGATGGNKRFTLVRPILQANTDPRAAVGIDIDYTITPISTPYITEYQGSAWDVAQWDVDLWGGELVPIQQWATVGDIGRAVSLKLAGLTNGIDVQLNGFDLMLEAARGPSL